jgi:hypothetical protein
LSLTYAYVYAYHVLELQAPMPTRTRKDTEKILWLRAHRGILSAIARKTHRTPQFVHLVFWGYCRSSDGGVERHLRRHGASMPDPKRRRNA